MTYSTSTIRKWHTDHSGHKGPLFTTMTANANDLAES